jgi:peptidoglycan hydrolase-like protein with peptidoglycan-binding domain
VSSSGKDKEQVIRVSVSPVVIQQALQNAGFYKGAIDGKIGSGTKSAIVNFQKSKGIKADGIIGRQTWELLKAYSN